MVQPPNWILACSGSYYPNWSITTMEHEISGAHTSLDTLTIIVGDIY